MLESLISAGTERANPSLGLANTLIYRTHPSRKEDRLQDFGSLVDWSKKTGMITEHERRKFKHNAGKYPDEAAAVFQRAIFLRETVVRILSAIASGKRPAAGDVSALNGMLSGTLWRLRIAPAKTGMSWKWSGWTHSLDSLLWPMIHSVAALLASSARYHLKECEGRGCGWFFLDTSRNQLRRWCSMNDCGNREKVRRFHARKKAEKRRARAQARK